MKIAMLTHSTNPRGGVVHALQLAEALHDLGHEAVLHAPAASGSGLFRTPRCRAELVPARQVRGGLAELVSTRIEDYLAWFSRPGAERFDVYHAHDGIGGNALATLAQRGAIAGYVRTVHHLEEFDDSRVAAWQRRAVLSAEPVLCVSSLWQDILREDWAVDAIQVPNGVDTQHFGPRGEARDARVRERLGITGAPVFLSVGGVEARKNTLCTLNAFLQLRRRLPHAQLVIAGGASLLDHHDYRQAFDSVVRDRGVESGPGRALLLTGTVPDADMPALYRSADALVFPSLLEGFGLVVLEAMASGVPAIVSRLAPFVEYLSDGDCLWVDPRDTYSVADAMQRACDPQHALALRRAGLRVAQRFGWRQSALRHLPVYQTRAAAGEVAHA